MWFVFGFITLISFSVYFGVKRYRASWTGIPSMLFREGIHYEHAYTYQKKDRIPSFKVGVKVPREFDFVFKRESLYDRICKFLGLSVEHQVGRAEFDKLVYIVSNDGHLLENLLTQETMRDGVLALFKLDMYECVATEICCSQGRLWATFKVGKLFQHSSDSKYLVKVEQRAVALLYALGETLKASRPQTKVVTRDPFVVRAAIMLACSSGLAVNGMAHFARLFWLTDDFTVDTVQLWLYAAYGAGVLVSVLVVLAVLLLGRSARVHLLLVELVVMGSVGALLTVFAEVRDLNMEADRSPVEIVRSKVLDKSVSKSRKGGTHYSVRVADWIAPGETRRIKVSSGFYAEVQTGAMIEFRQRAGFLGIRWVDSYGLVARP